MRTPRRRQANRQMPLWVTPRPGIIGFYTNKIHYLRKNVLDVLAKRKFATFFMKPVDKTKKPDYYELIETPMDLGKIKYRVMIMYYMNSEELLGDLYLLLDNSKKYIKPEDPKYRNLLKLERFIAIAVLKMPNIRETLYLGRPPPSETEDSNCSETE